jgi:hypothetical protein
MDMADGNDENGHNPVLDEVDVLHLREHQSEHQSKSRWERPVRICHVHLILSVLTVFSETRFDLALRLPLRQCLWSADPSSGGIWLH